MRVGWAVWCRSRDVSLSSVGDHPAGGEGCDDVGEQYPLDGFDAFVQGFLGVVGADRDCFLGQDRAGVDPVVDEVHGRPGDLDTVVECVGDPRVRRGRPEAVPGGS